MKFLYTILFLSLFIQSKTVDAQFDSCFENYEISLKKYEEGNLIAAQEYIEKAIKIRENNIQNDCISLADLKSWLGFIYKKNKNIEKSNATYLEAIEIYKSEKINNDQSIGSIYISIGLNYMTLKNYNESIIYLEKVLENDTIIYPNINEGNLFINLGICHKEINNNLLAIKYYEKGIFELKNKNEQKTYVAICINTLSQLYRKLFKYDKAIKLNEEAIEIIRNNIGETNREFAISLNNLALLYSEITNYEKSTSIYNQAYDILLRLYGKNHTEVALCLDNWSQVYKKMGDYDKAISLSIDALEIREGLLGNLHHDVGFSLNNLGSILSDKGEYYKALEYFQKAIEIENNSVNPDSSFLGVVLDNMAVAYSELANFESALIYSEKSQKIKVVIYGEYSSEVGICLGNLSDIYYKLGKYENALLNIEKALNIFNFIYGEEHPNIAMCLNNISLIKADLGQMDEAIILQNKALKMRIKLLGDKHPDVANGYGNLSNFHLEKGELYESLKLQLKALEINLLIYGEKHISIARCYNSLAHIYEELGYSNKAYNLSQNSINIRKIFFSDLHPSYAKALGNLASYYISLGQYDKALVLTEQELGIYKFCYNEIHPDIASCYNSLSVIHSNIGSYQKAISFSERAIEIDKIIYGYQHKNVAINLCNLAHVYYLTGDYLKTKKLLDESLLIFNKSAYSNTLETAYIYSNLGCFYSEGGQYDDALKFHENALNIKSKILGDNTIDIAISYNNIADVYFRKGQMNLSLIYYEKAVNIYNRSASKGCSMYYNLFQNIGNVYLIIGDENNARSNFNKSANMINAFIGSLLPNFNENQQLNLINTINENISFYEGLAFNIFKNDKKFIRTTLNNSMLYSNVALLSHQSMRKSILTSNDTLLIDDFENWLSLKSQYANAQSLSLDELKNNGIDLKAIEDSIEIKERSLSQRSQAFQTEQQKLELNYEALKANLKAEEATVMFHSFNYYNGKDWTDSTLYTAYIIRKDQKQPEMVYLFEQAALDTLLPAPDTRSMMNNLYQTGDSTLYNLVWKPLEPYLKGVKTAYVAPSGLLHKIAFAAVPLPDGSRLSDRYHLRQVLSGHDVVFKEDPAVFNNSSNTSVALLGGINYEYLPEAKDTVYFSPLSLLPESTDRGTAFGYLPGTESEVSSIEQLLKNDKVNVTLLKGNNATEEQFKTLQDDKAPKVLHIATHGFFAPDPKRDLNKENSMRLMGQENRYTAADNPLYRSGLLLAGGNSSWTKKATLPADQDGVLTAYEVANMDLSNTQLVVLSACETALGDVKGREGVFGLQRGFRLAGAKYMLMSLWRIPDKETAEYMTKFYSELAKTNNIVTAYQTTQNHMKVTYPNEPQIWAGMVLVE